MIIQIATPGNIPQKWRNLIQTNHDEHFGFIHHSIDDHWWFVDIRQGMVTGLAGAKAETKTGLFLGPCIVFETFRGNGLQRDFIITRERLASSLGYTETLTYTQRTNYYSANNFIRCGYTLCKPWDGGLDNDGNFLYWRKTL